MSDTTPETVTPTATETTPPVQPENAADDNDGVTLDEIENLVSSGTAEPTADETAAPEGSDVPAEEATTDETPESDAPAVSDVEVDEQAVPTAEATEPAATEPAPANPQVAAKVDDDAGKARLQAAQDEQAFRERVNKYETDQAAFDARVDAEGYEYDPFTDTKEESRLNREFRAIQKIELDNLRAVTQREEQQRAYADHFENLGKKHPEIGAKALREIWEDLYGDSLKRSNNDHGDAYAVTKFRFEERVKQRRAQATAAAKKKPGAPVVPARIPPKAPPVTRGGASVTPKPAARVPAPAPKGTQEKLEAGAYGDISSVVS